MTALTPEQIQLLTRLEGVFMPYATKRRNTIFEPHRDYARFVHYTSAEAALSIIKSKRMWMRNTNCMTDYREVQHGFEILNKSLSHEIRKSQLFQALDLCSPNAAPEAIGLFNQWWNDIRFNTYIASISEHDDREDLHGRLSMWRAFASSNVARVALVLRIPKLGAGSAGLNLMFSPVAYLNEGEVHTELDTIIQNIRTNCGFLRSVDRQFIIGMVFAMLLAGVVCLKHEGFHEEREWRVIYSPKRTPSSLMESSVEIIAGVPQIIHKIPLDTAVSATLADIDLSRMFDRLIIGPSPYPWPMYEAFVAALKEINVPNAEGQVFTSCIPIRPGS